MRTILACVFALTVLAFAPRAHACTNDIDCATAGCGGMVCQWGAGGHVCVPAGTAPQGSDGWCGQNSDCKCAALGATCAAPHCTFTLPPVDMASAPHDLSASLPPPDLTTSTPTTPKSSSGCAIGGAPTVGALPALGGLGLALALALCRRRLQRG